MPRYAIILADEATNIICGRFGVSRSVVRRVLVVQILALVPADSPVREPESTDVVL
jgi:hypothetical protein